MAGIEISDLAFKVKRRLNDIFPDDDSAAQNRKGRRSGLPHALWKLGHIASLMKWKMPIQTIRDYVQELNHLQSIFSGERSILVLIKVQSELCRYFESRRRNIHPHAMLLLLNAFTAMSLLASNHGLAEARQKELSRRIVGDYLAFKKSLTGSALKGRGKPGRLSRWQERPSQSESPASPDLNRPTAPGLGGRAYYLIPVADVADLKLFIRHEFDDLRARLSQKSKIPEATEGSKLKAES